MPDPSQTEAPQTGLVPVRQSDVTPEMAAWAKDILHDTSVQMGGTASRSFDGRAAVGRVEWHPPSPQIDHAHRGVSLYWQSEATAPSGESLPTAAVPSAAPAPTLLALRRQIDAAYPLRSRASDGIMASAQHTAQNPKSDHERGDALDVTRDTQNGPDLPALAATLLQDERVTYVILDRQIANRAIVAGAWRPYPGPDPHTSHLHVSILHDRRDDAGPWQIAEPYS